jgi:hypothetical protein
MVSRGYNLLFRVLFGIVSPDINGTPKFISASDWTRLRVSSTDYFLEAEMMLRARALGLTIELVPVDSQPRPGGQSKISVRLVHSCTEFLRNMIRLRLNQGSLAGSRGKSQTARGNAGDRHEILPR